MVLFCWYSYVMMRKKIVKVYMYIRILVGVVFISYRKKVLINMLIKVCFFFMEMSNCFEDNKWNDRNWNKL